MKFPNINAERARRGLTLEDLANLTGVAVSTVAGWLNGKAKIPAGVIITLAQEWGCSADYLLGIDT